MVEEEPPRKHMDISAPQLMELPKNINLIPLDKLDRSAIQIVDPALQNVEPRILKDFSKANSTNTIVTKPTGMKPSRNFSWDSWELLLQL